MNKKIFTFYLLCLLVSSCGDSMKIDSSAYVPSLEAHYLRPSRTEFRAASAKEETMAFGIFSIDTPWKFSNIPSWTSFSQTAGTTNASISLEFSENLSGDTERLGIFYLQSDIDSWNYSVPMTAFQPTATPYANPEKTSIIFDGCLSSEYLSISSNCSWEASCSSSWVTISADIPKGRLDVGVSENTTNTSRSASIYLQLGSKQLSTISITQKAANVNLETHSLDFENTAGEYKISITSEAAWTASTSQSWIQVSPESGNAGTETLTVSVSPNSSINERSGFVYIYVGTAKVVEIPVHQRGLYLVFGSDILTVPASNATEKVTIKSNTTWEIYACPDWISITPQSGEGSTEITLDVEDNPNVASRQGVVKVRKAGMSIESSLSVTQSGKSFSYGNGIVECSDKAQDLSLQITSDGSWTASTNESWIKVSPTASSGNGTLKISVAENTSDNSRTGIITLTIGNKSFEVQVIQSGKLFTVNYDSSSLGSKGGNIDIEISTNDSWTVSIQNSPSWLSVSKTSGDGNAAFTATIADNPSVNSRSAVMLISTKNGQSVKISVTQSARYMTVSTHDVLFYAKGGTYDDVIVDTDAAYSITKTGDWFTVSKKNDSVLIITAEENLGKNEREGTIRIAMTDLKEGTYSITLPVIQTAYGGAFIVSGYGDDSNWDIGSSGSLSISVIGYTSDANWDSDTQNVKFSINITGYNADSNWDTATTSSGTIGTDKFKDDSNWDR